MFRLGTSSTIDSLNPFIAFQSDADTAFEYIYPTLVQYTPSLKIVENFARSWKTSPDGRTWTFTTQPHAKWSDGKPLTAADAAWTFSTILKFADSATANSAGYVAHMKSATAPDATTLVLTYSQPVANVLAQVQEVPILPEHIWAQYATGNGKALKTFQNNAPIVSGGPFILTKYTPKQVALFKKNPGFYGPKPHVDGFGLQFFQTTDAEVTALKSGQLDAVEVPVPPTSVATLKAGHFTVRSTPGDSFDDFIINSNPDQQASHAELLNPLLRQAFDHAIDRQAVVATSLLGHGQPGSTIIPPATGPWSDPAIKPTSFSLAIANQLLDNAGYKMGPNGLRIANGHPMSYTVIMPSDLAGQYSTRTFQIIQPAFKKIGVQLNLKVLDPSAAYDALTANNYRNFEISMWDWFPLTDPDFMLSVLTCNSFDVWNDTGYCSKAYDNLYSRQSAAVNPAQRQQLVYQMQQMIASAQPYLVIDYPDSIEAQSSHWSPCRRWGAARSTRCRSSPWTACTRPEGVRSADYVIKRGFFALVTIFVAITINFFLFRVLPGNAITDLSRVPHASPALRHALLLEFGLDKPKWEQYLIYLKNLAHGNMGISFANQQPVSHLRSAPDHISTNLAIFAYAFPTQWLGLMLLILFAGFLPAGGMSDPFLFTAEPFWQHLGDISKHMILPAATLMLTAYGSYTLVVRSSMLETLGEDYVLTARAKGLPVRRIVWGHAVRNALLPMVTLIALELGFIVGGALLVEVIFSWPGIGLAMYTAIGQRDYPMLQGGFLILTVSVILLNFVADLLYFRLDPRITT